MGLFDWLFGRKKNEARSQPAPQQTRQDKFKHGDLGGSTPRQHGNRFSASGSSYEPPATEYKSAASPRLRRKPRADEAVVQNMQPPEAGKQRSQWLGWRRTRSKQPVAHVEEVACSYEGSHTFGGSPLRPASGGDAVQVAKHGLPPLANFHDLAGLLKMEVRDLFKLVMKSGARHYLFHEIPKKSGGVRLLMAPLPRMKSAQRRLLSTLVSKAPLHHAAHGFREGHDVMTNAGPHVSKAIVICMDISDFFPSFTFRRVSGYFRQLGYSRGVAIAIANLATWSPRDSFKIPQQKGGNLRNLEFKEQKGLFARVEWLDSRRYEIPSRMWPQLPQGAPTSPGIANAIAWRMDKRLSALARKFGGDYTRYADDLTFSGFEKMAEHSRTFVRLVEKIVKTEGLAINPNKTRVMRKGRRQKVTGVVVNKQTNLSRRDFDLLKAILHNCINKGPSTQNRSNHPNFKEHLRGRVAHALHIGPERGAKLKKLFDAIDWSR